MKSTTAWRKANVAIAALSMALLGTTPPLAAIATEVGYPTVGTTTHRASASHTAPPAPMALSQSRAVSARIARASTGQYEYICIGSDGSSWSLRIGEPTTDCHGSYLLKYINGVQVASYRLSIGGGIAAPVAPWSTGCVVAVASGVALFLFPPTGATAWVVVGGLTAAGLYTSCLA